MELLQQELITIGLLFTFAIVASLVAKRFKQPGVVGLLVVGAIIGPNMLGVIDSHELINLTIEFGAIFLLFAIGLEFNMVRLKKTILRAALTATLKVLIVFFLAFEISMFLFGLSPLASLMIGIILSFSSTVIMVNVLDQKKMIHKHEVPLLVAVLVVEDILAVFALTFLATTNADVPLLQSIMHIVFGIAGLALLYVISLMVLRPLVQWLIKNSEKDEIILFFAFTLCAGFSFLSYFMGLSSLIGAFAAGSLVATLPNKNTFEHYLRPYKAMFSSLFFLAIGMLVNVSSIFKYPLLIPVLLLIVFISRVVVMTFSSYCFTNLRGESIAFTSIALSCIGEFSLLVAAQARVLNLGIDLLTITSVLIIASAVFMAAALNMTTKLHTRLSHAIPRHIKSRITKVSFYMNALFEQLEMESTYTKRFKKEFATFMLLWPVMLLIIFSEVKIVALLGGKLVILKYLSYLLAAALVGYIMYLAGHRLYRMYRNLLIILSNMTYSTNLKRSKLVVKTFARALLFLICGLATPALIYSLSLPGLVHVVAFLLIGIGLVHIWWVIMIINSLPMDGGFSFPKYRKVSAGEMDFESY